MQQESTTGIKYLQDQAVLPIEIGHGNHGKVEYDPGSKLVCKQMRASDATVAAERAQREHDYLKRYSGALAGEPYLQCPHPARVEPERGRVWMTFCSGEPLDRLLSDHTNDLEAHLDHIARQVTVAVEKYIEEFNEPFYSLNSRNMLYEPSTDMLTLLDFASARKFPGINQQTALYEITLGCYIGAGIHTTMRIRPESEGAREYRRRQESLSIKVLTRLSATHNLCPEWIRVASNKSYRGLTKSRGTLRGLWYSTVGQAIFNRRRDAVIARSLRAGNFGAPSDE